MGDIFAAVELPFSALNETFHFFSKSKSLSTLSKCSRREHDKFYQRNIFSFMDGDSAMFFFTLGESKGGKKTGVFHVAVTWVNVLRSEKRIGGCCLW